MNRQQKKLQKKKEREKKVAKKKLFEHEEKLYRYRYPEFVFEGEDRADPRWVELVQRIVKDIDFREFPKDVRLLYDRMKNDQGFRKEVSELSGLELLTKIHHFFMFMGEAIFSRAGESAIKSWVPYNDIRVIPCGDKILVKFGGLLRTKGPHGTIYYSPAKPTVRFEGKEYIVGFSTHCIQQICSRLVVHPFSYAGSGDVFGFLHDCIHFEPVMLANNCPAFTFFSVCTKGFFNWNYVTKALGDNKVKDDGNYYSRLGYCPVIFEDGFAKAKTLLPPGYRTTPEWDCMYSLPYQKRQDYKKLVGSPLSSYVDKAIMKDNRILDIPDSFFEPMCFFHKFIPQVIHSEKRFYHRFL